MEHVVLTIVVWREGRRHVNLIAPLNTHEQRIESCTSRGKGNLDQIILRLRKGCNWIKNLRVRQACTWRPAIVAIGQVAVLYLCGPSAYHIYRRHANTRYGCLDADGLGHGVVQHH